MLASWERPFHRGKYVSAVRRDTLCNGKAYVFRKFKRFFLDRNNNLDIK